MHCLSRIMKKSMMDSLYTSVRRAHKVERSSSIELQSLAPKKLKHINVLRVPHL
jgi:hypothetical protein